MLGILPYMKIWLKYILGCALGIVLSIILQSSNPSAIAVVQYLSDFSLSAGRYALLPLLFFSMTVAVYEIRESKALLRTAFNCVIIALITTAAFTVLGVLSVLVFQPPRIPISVEEATTVYTLSIPENIMKLFPVSNFSSFLEGSYLLPLYVLAGFAGAGCASEKAGAKPTLTLFDSLSRVSYAVISFFIDMLAVGLIAVSCTWMMNFPSIWRNSSLVHLILLVGADAAAIILIIYPLLLRLIFRERHPYRVLFASTASIITAFFSGDYNLTLGVSIRHAKESLGIHSRISSVCLPVFSTFARGGAAMVLSISFVVISQSYSDMKIWNELPWIMSMAFVLSFLLGSFTKDGPIIALAVMCSLYGRGFDTSYLIIKPAAFFLCSAAAAIDVVTSFFGTYIIAVHENLVQHKELRFYI